MEPLALPSRTVPVRGGYDVFVAGAGLAGVAAAVCAARDDLRVAIVEYFGAPGGMPTSGLLAAVNGQRRGEEHVVDGIAAEMDDRLEAIGGRQADAEGRIRYDPERIKRVLLDMLTEAGVETFLYTHLIDAVTEDNRITHAVVASKSGIEAFEARLFVDDTGDADLAVMAGCPVEQGRESDGLTQSSTLVFKVCGIDAARAPAGAQINEIWVREKPDFPINHVVFSWLPGREGAISVNMVHILRFDGTSNTELTRARLEGTRQAAGMLEFFREKIPGFDNATIEQTAEQIGVRETRRIVGDYVLTEEDLIAGRSFPDEIVRGMWPIDVHNPCGVHTGIGQYLNGSYGVPYRCITPQGVENLYVVGRPISSTHVANSSTRINATCMGTGQAAGCAARMAIDAQSVRKVDVPALQDILRTQGAVLHPV